MVIDHFEKRCFLVRRRISGDRRLIITDRQIKNMQVSKLI